MKYMLDTHAFLWAIEAESNLSQAVREAIRDERNDVFLSIASLWEIAIKVSLGKLHLESTFLSLATELPIAFGLTPLEITPQHLDIVSRLPLHHRDPFDRLLVAQCLVEDMPILSNDAALDAYGVERIW